MAATTTLLGLVTPTQGTLTGTWGDTVNYGISDYLDIAIAGTLAFAGDGAITLANTTGSSSGNSIGATTAQYAIIRVTGTLTTAKIITGPSYSKTYLVVNAATGSTVTFKASGQTGVSIAVGETALVYYNGTDYVKVVGTATAGAAGGSTTQVQYNNAGVLAGITGATSNGTALTLVAPVLGSPASVGTMPAFTLGGTVSGGGNQINNVVIGTTTPLAGAFTTLTASTTLGVTGRASFGTSPPASGALAIKADTSADAISIAGRAADGVANINLFANNGTTYQGYISATSTGVNFGIGGAAVFGYTTAGAAVTGTLSATGTLSGGTSGTAYSFSGSAPATSLTLNSSGNLSVGSTLSHGKIGSFLSDATTTFSSLGYGMLSLMNSSSTNNNYTWMTFNESNQNYVGAIGTQNIVHSAPSSSVSGDLLFATKTAGLGGFPTEKMRLNSSGNLGLGVTPSAWGAGTSVIQLSTAGSAGAVSSSGTLSLANNGFFNGTNWIYNNTSSALLYQLISNEHRWSNAASGTAGNTISFTQAMTLDASGNLGIGTTSPSTFACLGVNKAITTGSVLVSAAFSDSSFNTFRITHASGSLGLNFDDTNLIFQSGGVSPTTRMTLTSSGNLGIGTSSPGVKLEVNQAAIGFPGFKITGTNSPGMQIIETSGVTAHFVNDSAGCYFGTTTSHPLVFRTVNTERMRLDSSGNLLVGATSNSTYPSRGYFVGSASFGGLSVSAPGSGAGYPIYFVDSDATSASQQMVHFDRGSSTVGYITTTNTTTSYSSASDYRLKNTITPITGALAKVVLLKPCTYKWNKDGSVGEGFIAHELQEVCPIAVYGTKDGIDADGKPDYQGVDTSFLVATLTAAIQEQQALITQLTARITALETL